MEQEGGIHHGWWQFKVMAVIIIIAFIGLCILLITPNHDPQIAINNVTSMNNGTIYAITTYYTGKPEVAWSECLGTVYYKIYAHGMNGTRMTMRKEKDCAGHRSNNLDSESMASC